VDGVSFTMNQYGIAINFSDGAIPFAQQLDVVLP